jgi:arginine-tRNA-protein transferase
MQLINPPQFEELSPCPYLPGRQKRYEYFIAGQLNSVEISHYLDLGWRKFGLYYFRPACPDCCACTPLRIPVAEFLPSRSQRRILKKGASLTAHFGALRLSDRAFAIYRDHSSRRFGQDPDAEDFILNFYVPSCPSMQTEIHVNGEMAGIGFLDRGDNCLSSVYFCFDTDYAEFNLGTFSVIKEIEQARAMGLTYYYLGYYVAGCRSLAYKDLFRARQHFDWQSQSWQAATDTPERLPVHSG